MRSDQTAAAKRFRIAFVAAWILWGGGYVFDERAIQGVGVGVFGLFMFFRWRIEAGEKKEREYQDRLRSH